ncbi:MAG: EF-hand domain-containing protein [Novosphingobium sp.]|nr:EF-hand domain-containing protein [Novosphingobium sp.]
MQKRKTALIGGLAAAALLIGGGAYAATTMGKGDMTRADATEHADKMFSRMDVNGDGKIDAADRDARVTERFDAIDTDGNGSISREEFAAGHQGMKGHRMGRSDDGDHDRKGHGRKGGHRGMAMMGAADTNGDGAVSKAEFEAAHLARFEKMDTNKDGTVSSDERQAARQDMRAKMKEMRQNRDASE